MFVQLAAKIPTKRVENDANRTVSLVSYDQIAIETIVFHLASDSTHTQAAILSVGFVPVHFNGSDASR